MMPNRLVTERRRYHEKTFHLRFAPIPFLLFASSSSVPLLRPLRNMGKHSEGPKQKDSGVLMTVDTLHEGNTKA